MLGKAVKAVERGNLAAIFLVLAGFGLAVLLPGLGSTWVLTQHEAWAVQPAREMLAHGDWVLPTYGAVPRTNKPPAFYWVVASFFAILGDAAWVARLPSVLAAILTAFCVALLGRRWFGPRCALVAGLIQLTSFYVLMQARLAEADMLLCAVVTAALTLFAHEAVGQTDARRPRLAACCLFYLLVAISALLKGPMGPAFIGVACGGYVAWQRDRGTLRFLLHPLGLILCTAATLAWPVAVYLAYPAIADTWLRETVGRFRGDLGGDEPWLFYFYMLPLMTLPWSPYAVLAAVHGWNGAWRQPSVRLLLCWVLPGIVLLSLSAFKHKHYMLPLLPPMSLAAAVGLLRVLELRQTSWRHRHWEALGYTTLGLGVSLAAWLLNGPDGAPVAILAAIAVAGALAFLLMEARQAAPLLRLGTMFATVGAVAAVIHVVVMPRFDLYRPVYELAERTNQRLPTQTPIYLVRLFEHQSLCYLRAPLQRVDHEHQLDLLGNDDTTPSFVLTKASMRTKLSTRGTVEELDRLQARPGHHTGRDPLVLLRFLPGPTVRLAASKSQLTEAPAR